MKMEYHVEMVSEDQRLFEKWAIAEGLSISKTCSDGASGGGLFPATYWDDRTETAWRAWANKNNSELAKVLAEKNVKYQDELIAIRNTLLEAKECLMDVVSHYNDFHVACDCAKKMLCANGGGESSTLYWTHQQNVLDRMKKQAENVLIHPEMQKKNNLEGISNERLVEALKSADWSAPNIGNKMLILAAIERLSS